MKISYELYAAVHKAISSGFLEKFANLGYNILQVTKHPDSEHTKVGYVGLDVFKDAIEKVLADQI